MARDVRLWHASSRNAGRYRGIRPSEREVLWEYPDPELIDRTLQLAFEAADVFFSTTTGRGIFETYAADRLRAIRRRAFSGAVFDFVGRDVDIAEVLQVSGSEQLSGLLQGVLKYAENTLRRQVGFRGQRRGVELPERLEAYLNLVLGSATSRPMAKPIERRTIHIDPAKIEALRRDSEQVRARLEAAEASMEEPQEGSLDSTEAMAARGRAVSGAAPPTVVARSTRFRIPPDTPAGLLTDVDRVASVLDHLVAVDLALLHELRAAGWELTGRTVSVVERVRAASEHVLGDPLVAYERDRQWSSTITETSWSSCSSARSTRRVPWWCMLSPQTCPSNPRRGGLGSAER